MPLSFQEQLDLGVQSITRGDMDTFSRLLTDPDTITPADQQSVAEKLGIQGGLLKAFVNTAADPVVWLAFWMQKRFPTLAWLRGQVPQRFIGAANEFTGVSAFTRPVETFFRGTTVPPLVALAERRKAEVLKVGRRMFDRMNRPNWPQEMETVSLLLEGRAVPASTELQGLARGLRGDMEELWGFLRKTQKIRGGFDGSEITRASAEPFAVAEAPRHLRDFLPHIPLLGDEELIRIGGQEALAKLSGHRLSQAMRTVGESPTNVWRPDQAGRLTSDFTRYQSFLNNLQGQVFTPSLFRRRRFGIPLASRQGQELFVTDLNVVLQKYTSSVARTYALNAPITDFERALATVPGAVGQPSRVPSSEPLIVQILNEGLGATGGVLQRRAIRGTSRVEERLVPGSANTLALTGLRELIRNVRGSKGMDEIVFGNLFSSIASKFDRTIGNVTGRRRSEADHLLRSVQRDRQFRSVSNGIASYFYSTTLGINPWSALQNLSQPILTTAPSIGIGPTLAGMRQLGRRIPRYAQAIRRNLGGLKDPSRGPLSRLNTAAENAFAEVFPELGAVGIKLDPRLFDIDPTTTVPFGPRATRAFRSYDDFAKFLLQPFTQAELSNQAVTFFGAKQALRDAMKVGTFELPVTPAGKRLTGQALESFLDFHAGETVAATQFRPGSGSRTLAQMFLPAPLRQFTSFPVRLLSFMGESTVRGAMTQAQLENSDLLSKITGGRNLGTLARMVMFGRIAQNGARDVLGIDLSNVLGLTTPFSVAPPSQPFAPLPVPPIASTVFGLVSAATTRDVKRLQPLILPGFGEIPLPRTLFPGGVGLTKVARAVNQWRPDIGGFVDDDERLLYRGNTSDFVMSMLGIPLDKNRRIRDTMDRISSLRGRTRAIRRQAMVSIVNADMGGLQKAQADWAEAFPDLPPLSVSQRDVTRYRDAARVPLIQRTLQTMGQAGRFLEAEIYEVDPEIIAPAQSPLTRGVEALGAVNR